MTSFDRAIRLLGESDEVSISNGCALIINAAAQPTNIPGILGTNAISLIGRILDSHNGDPLMKAVWAISNLTVHDQSREAVYQAGIIPKLSRALNSGEMNTTTKACWAITNLARLPQGQAEIVNCGLLSSLTDLLKSGSDEIRAVVLQPLCNIVAHEEYQLLFRRNQGLHPAISLMSSNEPSAKELAVTLVSFITTTHDSIREDVVSLGGLRPLCVILTDITASLRLKELSLNTLINLSISENNEEAIIEQGVIPTVLQLLSDPSEALRCNSAMLLSNLFTNANARERVRNLNWCNPVLTNIQSGSAPLVTQLVRVIVNITFDEFCRYQLVQAGAEDILDKAEIRLRNGTVSGLVNSALKNLSVPVSEDTMRAVGNAPPPSTERYIAPSVSTTVTTNTTNVRSNPPPSNTVSNTRSATDDIDDILGDISSMTSTSSKPYQPSQTTYKPPPSKSSDALDDILGDIDSLTSKSGSSTTNTTNVRYNPPPSNTKTISNDLSDIDDILADIEQPQKFSFAESVSSVKNRPVTQRVSHAFRDDFNDIDDLLSGITDDGLDDLLLPPEPETIDDFADIDDLLSDISGGSSSNRSNINEIDDILNDIGNDRGNDDDDIDALLNDISSTPSMRGTAPRESTADLEAIDDLLAELTF